MNRDYIKFTNYHVPDIILGEKTLTARYGWDDVPKAGSIVDLVDGNDVVFGKAMILWETSMTIQEFVDMRFEGHVKYYDPEHMIENMNLYYDDELTPETELDVIAFELLDEHEMY